MRLKQCRDFVRDYFRLSLPVDRLLFDDIETGDGSYLMIFQGGDSPYGLFIADGSKTQTYGDVKEMAKQVGLTVESYFPPHADQQYFKREGEKLFQAAFPALKSWTEEDTKFYQQLVEYSPALVRISNIGGELRRYDVSSAMWQKAFEVGL